MRRLKRLVFLLVLAVASAVLGPSQARAESSKAVVVPVSCDNGTSFETTLPPYGQAVPIIGSTSNFMTVTLSVMYADGTTEVLHSSNADPKGQPLVTCLSVGPFTGNNYTLVGFFTPVG